MSDIQYLMLKDLSDDSQQAGLAHDEDFDFEMANLTEEDTGVAGTIYISSKFPRHAPRVKWYEGRPKNPDKGYIALSIDIDPISLENRIGQTYSTRTLNDAKAWIAKNADALMVFWERGALFDRREMNAFLDGLKKL